MPPVECSWSVCRLLPRRAESANRFGGTSRARQGLDSSDPHPDTRPVRDSPSPQPRPDMHVQHRAGPGSSTCEVTSTKESGALWRLNSRRC